MCFTRTNLMDLVIQQKNVEKYHEIFPWHMFSLFLD